MSRLGALSASLVLVSCVSFEDAEIAYCLRHLDVCGVEETAARGGGQSLVADPSALEVFGREDRAPGAVEGTVRFVYDDERELIGYVAELARPLEASVAFCAGPFCQEMSGEVGYLQAHDPALVENIARGGAYVEVRQGNALMARGHLRPPAAELLIAEIGALDLPSAVAGEYLGHVVAVITPNEPSPHFRFTAHGLDASFTLGRVLGGPWGGIEPQLLAFDQLSGEIPIDASSAELLAEQAYHVRVEGSQVGKGHLLRPGFQALHAAPRGDDDVADAFVTMIADPERREVGWLVETTRPSLTVQFGAAPFGVTAPLLTTLPVGFTPQTPLDGTTPAGAIERRLLYVEVTDTDSGGERGTAHLLRPGEQLFGGVLYQAIAIGEDPSAGVQVVIDRTGHYLLEAAGSDGVNGTLDILPSEGQAPLLSVTPNPPPQYSQAGLGEELADAAEEDGELFGSLSHFDGSLSGPLRLQP